MSQGNDDNWEMPKPVFRSTSGSLPKSFEETISQSFIPDTDTVEIDEDDDILSIMDAPVGASAKSSHYEPATAAENAGKPSEDAPVMRVRALPPKPQGEPAGFRSFLVIFILIALVAAAIVGSLIYYFTNIRSTEGNF